MPKRVGGKLKRLDAGGVSKARLQESKPAPSPSLPRELILVGQIPSGKNNMQVTRTGRHYPNLRFQLWRDDAVYELMQQWKQPALTMPMRLVCRYWPGDRRTRDVPGMMDAVFHALMKAEIVQDDGLIYDCQWCRYPLNRTAPKVLMTLTEWT